MAEPESQNLVIRVSGPLRLVQLRSDPVPPKALPSRDAWTLIHASSAIRVCTGDDHEEGIRSRPGPPSHEFEHRKPHQRKRSEPQCRTEQGRPRVDADPTLHHRSAAEDVGHGEGRDHGNGAQPPRTPGGRSAR